jgi:hypothetical protein
MTVGYHGVPGPDVTGVERDGLLIDRTSGAREGCFWHLSIAETPEIAAAFAHTDGVVFRVDLEGLDLPEEGFFGGEMRLHQDIPSHRLSRVRPTPTPDRNGHLDPAYLPGGNHPTCLRLRCWEKH